MFLLKSGMLDLFPFMSPGINKPQHQGFLSFLLIAGDLLSGDKQQVSFPTINRLTNQSISKIIIIALIGI